MPNQYTKVPLFIEEDDSFIDISLLSKELTFAVIEAIKDILPKDIETTNQLITKIKDEV
ncbi:hypothetical protein [uncultured Clostridium sp.]|jgi:hypothetical protein|uniref:hypothetical protein n=1 Tax=uncultured Clostridium sp. TaxID=59620 RepID=UPI00258E58B5|nr:hypothetical protein [uncultured Clostridium sp.]